MEVVRRHGFTPQWAAQSLRTRRTNTVGFVVPNLTNGFFGRIAMVVDAHFREVRTSTLICFTAKKLENELDSLRSLLGKNVDGIIFAPSGCSVDYFKVLPALREKPLVIIDNRCESINACHVLHDNVHGMRLLADHMVARGHRSIGYVGGPREESSAAERLEGYREALAGHGIAVGEDLVRTADWDSIAGGHEATRDLLTRHRGKLSAILYGNSQLLLGGYKAIHGLGLRMPADVAVACFDSPYDIDSLVPRPTALGTVEEAIGLAAARLLQDLIAGRAPVEREVRVRSELCVGESSG